VSVSKERSSAAAPAPAPGKQIELRGVRVHNLQNLDLNLPLHRLIVLTGVSGSGKSSLAFDTLYAEGQRRYIESFSAYARQFLERLERPDADRIDHLPPAIAIRQQGRRYGRRATVSSATEIAEYLKLLYARIGRIFCPQCGVEVRRETPADVAARVNTWEAGRRFLVGFPQSVLRTELEETLARLTTVGFSRAIIGTAMLDLSDRAAVNAAVQSVPGDQNELPLLVILDRLVSGKVESGRLADSVEQAFHHGSGQCVLLAEGEAAPSATVATIDGRVFERFTFSQDLRCGTCREVFSEPEPRLFSPNSPLGACPTCSGFGRVPEISMERIVPDSSRTLREGAIAAWTTPAYRHELDELLELAPDYGIPVDVPFRELKPEHLRLIHEGVPERNFGGLWGFFRWLERRTYKLGIRVFLNRWRTYVVCPDCRGYRLRPQALAVRVGGRNIGEVQELSIAGSRGFLRELSERLAEAERRISSTLLEQILTRLAFLEEVGLSYLTLDRAMTTLSGGESQRVALTAALGTRLVNTLYVLDEPSTGLHPRDNSRLLAAIESLRDLRNTVVVVEHDEEFIRHADMVVDIGPGAGSEGGRLVFQGTPAELPAAAESLTGAYLSGRRSIPSRLKGGNQVAREPTGWLRLDGAREHNLQNLTVEFPLGVLCVVSGVSGSGKSTLVQETLYPALCQQLGQECAVEEFGTHDRLSGAEALNEVLLVDQSSIGRTPRSNPVTYLKAFDDIRKVFAEIPEAKLRNLKPGSFSFNSASGGRCPTCEGNGTIEIDMQFLADIAMTCPDCHGTRYQREILDVKYRGLNIAEVLAMTVHDAITFFRGQPRLQRRLSHLKSVGLDYLTLGQPANTLSGGESQRLKLAAALARRDGARCLFLLDEPTTGLHFADVAQLLECFSILLAAGHSLIVIEHNLDVIAAAEYVIDLGPEAGNNGGRLVASGPPEELCRTSESVTGQFLRAYVKAQANSSRPDGA